MVMPVRVIKVIKDPIFRDERATEQTGKPHPIITFFDNAWYCSTFQMLT